MRTPCWLAPTVAPPFYDLSKARFTLNEHDGEQENIVGTSWADFNVHMPLVFDGDRRRVRFQRFWFHESQCRYVPRVRFLA